MTPPLIKIKNEKMIAYFAYALVVYIIIYSVIQFGRPAGPVYLSDLSPIKYYQQHGQLHMDRTVMGNRLVVNGFFYTKGIGTHANSSIEYQINSRYRFLEGAVGLDDDVANNGNKIEAMIYADNKLIYRSGILQGWMNPHYFRLNIAGTKVLKLVINDGGDGANYDHSDWLGIQAIP